MSEKKEKKGAEGGKGIARGYGMNECPRPAELGAFGLQHALLILFQTLPAPLLIAGGLGFGPLETSLLIASALFVSGICTFVQSFGVGPLGAKIPMVQVGSFVFIAPALLIAPQAGFGGYMGACIVAAIVCGVVFVLFSDWLKVIFPSFISGAVLLVLGTGLIGNALANCAGGSGAETFGDPVNLALAAATFLITLVLSVFGKGFLQGAAPLIGMAVGFVIAICMGMVDFSSVSEAAWFGLPQPLHWGISFPVDACLVMTLVAVCGVVEILGTTAATTTVAAGRMATPGETKKTVLTQAVGSVFAGLFNAVPTISGSANIGLMDVTRVFTRYAVSVAGGFILLMGLCPKLSAVFSVIPNPVFGGAVLMLFGSILVNGMKIIMDSEQTSRTQTILAVSLAVGIGFNSVAGALDQFPFWVSTMLCGVPGTAFVAVILNVLLPGRNLKKQPLAAGGAEAVVAVEGKPANVPGAALPGDGSGAVPEALGLVEDEEATAQRS